MSELSASLVVQDESSNAYLWRVTKQGKRFVCRIWTLNEHDLRVLSDGDAHWSTLSDKAPENATFDDGEAARQFFAPIGDAGLERRSRELFGRIDSTASN